MEVYGHYLLGTTHFDYIIKSINNGKRYPMHWVLVTNIINYAICIQYYAICIQY